MKNIYQLNSINKNRIMEMLGCIKPLEKKYERGDSIMQLDQNNSSVGIIRTGTAHLTTTTFDGTKTIIDYFEPGSIFGSHLSPCTDTDPYIVTAKTKCTIYIADYRKLITCCDNCCEKHIALIDGLLQSTTVRAQLHVEILSRRTIRSKLLTYFFYIHKTSGKKQFYLPLSLSDLADYISADRSAMMREIKKLNCDGIISSKGHEITILKEIPV